MIRFIRSYLSYSSNLITQLVTIYDLKYLQKNPCCCHHLLILLNINVHKFLYDQEEYGNDDIGSKGIWVRELREECVSNRKGNVVREFLSTWLGINSHGISEVQCTIICDRFEPEVWFLIYYIISRFTDMNSFMFIK